MLETFENEFWVKENFMGASFNDARLNKRLCKIATEMATNPEGSIPEQMREWKDVKGCYEFLKNKKITHKRIQTPHRKRTINLAKESKKHAVLFIQDTSELDYSDQIEAEGLGQIGNEYGKGIMMHSCLAVKDEPNCKILGLAHQIVWERKEKSLRRKFQIGEQLRKEKESVVWSQTLRAIGRPEEKCTWVTISDRGSDSYDYFCDLKVMNWEGVIRANHDRAIEIKGEKRRLKEWVRSLEAQGSQELEIRMKGETKKREIKIKIAWDQVKILPPEDFEDKEIKITVIRGWNEEGIEWILYSTIEVSHLEEAIEKLKWYAIRWTIEDYHKCLKTGCGIEKRQLQTSKGLEALVGVLGIVAILLLHLRSLARESSKEKVDQFIPETALKIICKKFKLNIKELTIQEFWRSVARMGGFLNRKSDGDPGWQTLWKGWLRLLEMMEAIELLKE